jgi:hypothetical protein
MKIFKAVLIMAVLLFLPAYAVSSNLGYMHINLMEGDVQIKTPEAGDWGLASINAPLQEGDQIWVPEGGRAELQLNTGTYVRLDENSALQVLSMDVDSSQFYLSQGHAYVYYNAPEGGVIQIDTPDVSTRAFNTAIFRIDIPDQYTDAAVYKGYVETENEVGNARINAGEMLSLGRATDGEVAPMGPPDEWENWNKARDERILERGADYRYLPPGLRAYSYDFESYGKWVDVPEFGHCWTPAVAVGAGWAPYREGRWIWSGGEYVWIAYEPWGWAPYHYGRWTFVAGIGWCWVPPPEGAVYWGPGYVGWVRTADYVAWVPLAPGEIYYGRGYYGPHSVNIINVNISRVRIKNVYKNVYVNNGVTVVERKTFATPSHRIVNLRANIIRDRIFAKRNINVGEPAIRPKRESYFMSAKRTPASKLPPKPVRDVSVKELKHSRPFVKAPDRSVLHPGAGPNRLPVKTVTTPKGRGKGMPTMHPVRTGRKGKGESPAGATGQEGRRLQLKPEKRTVTPEGRSVPGEEKRLKLHEKESVSPQGVPRPGEERRSRQAERRIVTPEGRPGTQEERNIRPPERRPVPPQERPGLKEGRRIVPSGNRPVLPENKRGMKEEQQHITPTENGTGQPGSRPGMREERQIRPSEDRPSMHEGVPEPRVSRPHVKPEKKPEASQKGGKKKKKEQEQR